MDDGLVVDTLEWHLLLVIGVYTAQFHIHWFLSRIPSRWVLVWLQSDMIVFDSFWSRLEMILLSLLIFWMVEFQCLVVLLIQKILLIGIIVRLECEDNNLTHKLIIIRLTQTSKLINYHLLIYFILSNIYFHSEDFVKISRRTDLSNSSELLKRNPQEVLMMMMMSCKRNVVWIDLDSSFNPSWFHDRT